MSDLNAKEQKAVRNALKFLRLRVGAWGRLAKALRYEWESIQKVATGKKAVTPALALRVARFANVPMDELLAGQWLSPRVCPHCGHPPDDFVDEDTIAGRRPVAVPSECPQRSRPKDAVRSPGTAAQRCVVNCTRAR